MSVTNWSKLFITTLLAHTQGVPLCNCNDWLKSLFFLVPVTK